MKPIYFSKLIDFNTQNLLRDTGPSLGNSDGKLLRFLAHFLSSPALCSFSYLIATKITERSVCVRGCVFVWCWVEVEGVMGGVVVVVMMMMALPLTTRPHGTSGVERWGRSGW